MIYQENCPPCLIIYGICPLVISQSKCSLHNRIQLQPKLASLRQLLPLTIHTTHTHTHKHTHIRTHLCTHTHTRTHAHTYTHAHMHTYTPTHTRPARAMSYNKQIRLLADQYPVTRLEGPLWRRAKRADSTRKCMEVHCYSKYSSTYTQLTKCMHTQLDDYIDI